MSSVSNRPFREAFERSGLSLGEVARRLGWTRPDQHRVARALGYCRISYRQNAQDVVDYGTAVRLCEALDVDPGWNLRGRGLIATLAITLTAGTESGAIIRQFAEAIKQAAADVPDNVPTGASTVLTIDNAPSSGSASFQITGGPYTSGLFRV